MDSSTGLRHTGRFSGENGKNIIVGFRHRQLPANLAIGEHLGDRRQRHQVQVVILARHDEQNDEIIADFKANKFPILVQVQMFGEGSDNVRASVGLWLSLIGSYNPSCYQAMVRHIRRNPNIDASKDFAYLFIPEDSPGLAQAEAIQNENDYCVDSESVSDSEESESRQLTLPTLEELEKQIKATAAHLLDVESPETLQRKIDQVKSDLLSSEYCLFPA